MSAFEKIKAHVEAGKDINQYCNDYAVLFDFLDSYYLHDAYGYASCTDVPEDAVAEELELPLAQRKSGVLEQVEWLLSHGADVNDGGDWLPLMLAVGYLDVAMTEWLLEQGANPHSDLDEESPFGCGNYYIDELDAIALHESLGNGADKRVFEKILQIALLFAKKGVANIQTHCIKIDSNTVSVSQAKVKF